MDVGDFFVLLVFHLQWIPGQYLICYGLLEQRKHLFSINFSVSNFDVVSSTEHSVDIYSLTG